MTTALRRLARAGSVGVIAVAAITLTAAPASAHVTVSPSVTSAGAYTVLTFSVPHGCDGSGTAAVSIQIPEQIMSVTPTVNPNWTVEKVMAELDPPVTDGHGNEITERVAEVVYTTAEPLPDGLRDAFQLSLQLPDAAGETLMFPTVQTCEEGETAWVQEVVDGQPEPDHPAPAFEVTPATGDGDVGDSDGADAEADGAEDSETVATTTRSSDGDGGGSGSGLTWVALVIGALGLGLGLLSLLRPGLLANRETTS